jgi:hypothetical protein
MIGNALNAFGKFQAYMGLTIALCICMSLTGSGILIIRTPAKFTASTTGQASNVMCASNTCSATVSLSISGNAWTVPNLVYPQPLMEGANVKVYYSADTPPKFSTQTDATPTWLAPTLISVGVCILLVAAFVAYLVTSSRGVSQITGGLGIMDALGR